MKLFLAIAGAAALLAAPAAQASEALAKSKGCTACHANDKKLIGPAYKEVAKKHKGDAKATELLVTAVVKGSQNKWGPIPMPPNKVTDEEAKALVAWILAM